MNISQKLLVSLLLTCLMFQVVASDVKAAGPTGFVVASGTSLTVDGKSFVPKGTSLIDFESFWDETKTQPSLIWTREKDFQRLKKAGFNSVRLVVKADYFQTITPPHEFSEQSFAWLDQVIALAKKYDQKVILDMHIPTGGKYQDYQIYPGNQIFWNDPWMKGRFVDVWREIARRYADEPTIWAYDLMNEAATIDFPAYEKLMRDTARSIRLYDANHLIMLQRGMYVKPDQSWGMKYPNIGDSKTINSIHFYQPVDFSLQGAAWITKQKPMVTYPTPLLTNVTTTPDMWDETRVKQELSVMIQEAQASGTPAVLTEFGAIFPPKLSGQFQWINDVASTTQAMGVGWHYWNYSSPSCFRQTALWEKDRLCHPKTWAMLSGLAKH